MDSLENEFSDFKKSIIHYQNHALSINEFKNNGTSHVSIDNYLHLLDSFIIILRLIEENVDQYEIKVNNQKEQIDSLLGYINKNINC